MGAQRDINEVEAILLNYIRIPKEKRNISLYDAIIGLSPVYLEFVLLQTFNELNISCTSLDLFKSDLTFNQLVAKICSL